MKDYNLPPTEEFEMLTNSIKGNVIPGFWLTMMKSVMNDYWFDAPKDDAPWRDYEFIDHLFHKLYYCWLMTLKIEFGDEEE